MGTWDADSGAWLNGCPGGKFTESERRLRVLTEAAGDDDFPPLEPDIMRANLSPSCSSSESSELSSTIANSESVSRALSRLLTGTMVCPEWLDSASDTGLGERFPASAPGRIVQCDVIVESLLRQSSFSRSLSAAGEGEGDCVGIDGKLSLGRKTGVPAVGMGTRSDGCGVDNGGEMGALRGVGGADASLGGGGGGGGLPLCLKFLGSEPPVTFLPPKTLSLVDAIANGLCPRSLASEFAWDDVCERSETDADGS